MIRFIVHADHQQTMRPYAERWGGEIGRRIELVSYDELFRSTRVPACTHVFTDLERLGDADAESAAYVWGAIRSAAPDVALLNHPLSVMRRYELLRTLHESGLNRFDVYRAIEARKPRRFPVFLRGENDHAGAATALLHSQSELDAALAALVSDGRRRESILTVEFCAEPCERRLFRKYAAFYVDGAVIPRNVMQSQSWLVKSSSRFTDETFLEEERAYLASNPHADWIRRVFGIARIDYGRVDYGLVGSRPHAYEINTNPTIISAEAVKPNPASVWFLERFAQRLGKLEAATPSGSDARRSVLIEKPLKSFGARIAGAVLQRVAKRQLRRSI